jgi:hypothetical protein
MVAGRPPPLDFQQQGNDMSEVRHSAWTVALAMKYPLALSEMRWPSQAPGAFYAAPLAKWGIEIRAGWRGVLARLLERLEVLIAAQPAAERDRFRVTDVKEKFGRLVVYLASGGTDDMAAAIQAAYAESETVCDICGAPGHLAERGPTGWWSTRCPAHEAWTPHDGTALMD